jgi:hypothetical protein
VLVPLLGPLRFKVDGVEHREKVGRRGDAMKSYALRKADVVRGVKLPANMKHKGVKFAVIAQEAKGLSSAILSV